MAEDRVIHLHSILSKSDEVEHNCHKDYLFCNVHNVGNGFIGSFVELDEDEKDSWGHHIGIWCNRNEAVVGVPSEDWLCVLLNTKIY